MVAYFTGWPAYNCDHNRYCQSWYSLTIHHWSVDLIRWAIIASTKASTCLITSSCHHPQVIRPSNRGTPLRDKVVEDSVQLLRFVSLWLLVEFTKNVYYIKLPELYRAIERHWNQLVLSWLRYSARAKLTAKTQSSQGIWSSMHLPILIESDRGAMARCNIFILVWYIYGNVNLRVTFANGDDRVYESLLYHFKSCVRTCWRESGCKLLVGHTCWQINSMRLSELPE